VLVDQFTRIRDGDRFWFENRLTAETLEEINQTRLSDIIERNTDILHMQQNVFISYERIGGGQKSDSIIGSDENHDLLIGFHGNDLLLGLGNDDQLHGDDGQDVLYGGEGNDWLEGGKGGDKLFGDQGDDTLNGGPGYDIYHGGEGDDVFVMDNYNDTDKIVGFDHHSDDQADNDRIDLRAFNASFEDLSFHDRPYGTLIKLNHDLKIKVIGSSSEDFTEVDFVL